MSSIESSVPTAKHLEGLNAAQREAVTFGIRPGERVRTAPPLLVIAGAGSGKTQTLTHRVAHLVANGADPQRILLLTFARRMAAEMTRRAAHVCAQLPEPSRRLDGASFPWAGTFHAIGAKLLRLYAQAIGLDPAFSILDRSDAEDLLDLCRDELELASASGRFPKKSTCLSIYSYVVNAQSSVHDALARVFPWCAPWEAELKRLFSAYVDAKQSQCALDYDDLLLYWSLMMATPAVGAEVAQRFDFVLVDEYQDTNALQAAILFGLKPSGEGVTVVGDDAQSIYSFRSARVANIREFPDACTPRAAIVKLEQNYRSTQPILTACNRIIARAVDSIPKVLVATRSGAGKPALCLAADETEQVRWVIERILRNREQGVELRQQAVLIRAAHHSSLLEVELARRNIPFAKFGGLKFLEAAHVKDMLALLRWAENPRDRMAGIRVLKLLPGVGAAMAHKAFAALPSDRSSFSVLDTLRVPAKAKVQWRELAALMTDLAGSSSLQCDFDRVRGWYDPLLLDRYENGPVRLGDLDQLGRIAATHATRSSFLTEITLDPADAVSDEAGAPVLDDDWLTISTIHSAKGREWRAVCILNVVDGCIPSDLATGSAEQIEEERRLLYVAMTRARDDLALVQPLRFYTRGLGSDNHVYAARSRFIQANDLPYFEECTASPAHSALRDALLANSVDLRTQVRRMWE